MAPNARSLQHKSVDGRGVYPKLRAGFGFGLLAIITVNACQCEDGLGVLNATVEVDPPRLNFQDVPLETLKTLPLKIWNRGSFVLSIKEFTADGPFVPPVVTTTVGIGYSHEVMVGFRPTALGPIEGTLSFKTSDPDAPMVTVPLQGVGIEAAIIVEPSMLDFGDVIWKTRSPQPDSKMITISNPGTDSFDLTSISLSDDGQGVFTLDSMMAQSTYAPGDSKTVSVSFAPTSKGMHSGSLEIINTTPSAPNIVVPLQGKAVGPILNLCANITGGTEVCSQDGDIPRIDFGYVDPEGLGTGTVRAINEGDRTLKIEQTLVTGTDQFFTFNPEVIEDQVINIEAGQQNSWAVTFTPDNYQPGTIVMSFTTNASNNDSSMVSGASSVRIDAKVGKATINVQPVRVTFNQSGNGVLPPARTKVRIFSCGTKDLVIGTISLRNISGPNQAFSLENLPMNGTIISPQNCGTDLAEVDFNVVFSAAGDGNYSAEAIVNSNDPNTPALTIELSGSRSGS